jgi:pimeloyl-ACP methyl ester carboxylesterase
MNDNYADRTWTSVDGLQLYARDFAGLDGPAKLPVVCVHGLTRNSRDFEDVAPWIAAQGRRVLAVDVRGRGRSDRDPNPANYQPAVYAADMVRLMMQAGIGRAVFLGTSMGGLITMALAATNPLGVAAAILNDVGPELATAGLTRIASYVGKSALMESWEDAAEYLAVINGAAFPHYGPEEWLAFARRTCREENGRVVLDYDPQVAAAFADYKPGMPMPDMWPLFANLVGNDRPVLVVRGGISDLLDEDIFARMREAAPDMAHVEVEGVGHAPMLTEPDARDAIARFLAAAP